MLKRLDAHELSAAQSMGMGVGQGRVAPRTLIASGTQTFALILLCLALLLLGRLDYTPLRDLRQKFTDLAAPALDVVTLPAARVRRVWQQVSSYAEVFTELDRLKEENQRLRQWEWQAQRMERRLVHMRSLLNAVDDPGLVFKTGRVIADVGGPFARAVLVNMGRDQQVKRGYAVINAEGLVGHVVHVGATASRVLLLSDLDSRIPVAVGPMGVRAVLAGDNAGLLRLEFLPDSGQVYAGDDVFTSGDDGILPRGLRVGTVVELGVGALAVRLRADLDEIEYVSLLFFDAPTVPVAQARGGR